MRNKTIKEASLIFGDAVEPSLISVNKRYSDELTLKYQILELDRENKKLHKYYKAHVSMCQENARLREEIKELESNVATLRLALMTIEDWNDHTVEERVNIGAQGQKEHYREIASDALVKLNK